MKLEKQEGPIMQNITDYVKEFDFILGAMENHVKVLSNGMT